ncbi:MAG TPA: PaaI family thioesterase [Thermoanaerobaculia bacterium]|jgi:uncharacterized protein (TIGR00369 family)
MHDHEPHWRALERIYLRAPTNEYYQPAIRIGHAESEIRITARPDFHHAAHAVHGSVYFKLLDDAAFFAANSLVPEAFVLTSNFTIHLLRPVVEGIMVAKGRVVHATARQFVAEAHLYDAGDRLVAQGVGTFVRSKLPLAGSDGYDE